MFKKTSGKPDDLPLLLENSEHHRSPTQAKKKAEITGRQNYLIELRKGGRRRGRLIHELEIPRDKRGRLQRLRRPAESAIVEMRNFCFMRSIFLKLFTYLPV